MRRLFALLLVGFLWFSFAPPASADVAGLTPCRDSAAFVQRAKNAATPTAKARFEKYADSNLLCGPEGLPHLIVDGRLDRAKEFMIPGLLFLYIAGLIGWAGRSYLISTRKGSNPEEKEIIIDVPLALQCFLGSLAWPLSAVGEFTGGTLTAKDTEVPVSPR
jgi:photosystem I subunit III